MLSPTSACNVSYATASYEFFSLDNLLPLSIPLNISGRNIINHCISDYLPYSLSSVNMFLSGFVLVSETFPCTTYPSTEFHEIFHSSYSFCISNNFPSDIFPLHFPILIFLNSSEILFSLTIIFPSTSPFLRPLQYFLLD